MLNFLYQILYQIILFLGIGLNYNERSGSDASDQRMSLDAEIYVAPSVLFLTL